MKVERQIISGPFLGECECDVSLLFREFSNATTKRCVIALLLSRALAHAADAMLALHGTTSTVPGLKVPSLSSLNRFLASVR